VAINAKRAALIAFEHEPAMNALVVNLLDLDVATSASLGHVRAMDRRIPVHRPPDVMDAVAITAGRRHDQSHLEQAPAMNAVHVLVRHLRILDPVLVRQTGIAVALGARARQVQLENRRVRMFDRANIMRAVAIPATGRSRGPQVVADAMNAHGVFLAGPEMARISIMTIHALRRRQFGSMEFVLDANVTIHAVELGVDGFIEEIGRKNERNLLVIDPPNQARIGVAIQTNVVRDLFPRQKGRLEQEPDKKKQPRFPGERPQCRARWRHTAIEKTTARRRGNRCKGMTGDSLHRDA
jgi:hypothetical protein